MRALAGVLLAGCAAMVEPPDSGAGTGGGTTSSVGGGNATGGGGGSATGGGTSGTGGGSSSTTIPMFVAAGHVGRTIISCDDGRTWVANRSDEDGFNCFVAGGNPDGGSEDCDHNSGAGHGVAFSNGWFVASFGWGPPGGIRRSRDGVSWAQTLSGTTFQGVVAADGVILASAANARWSRDEGLTWDAGGPTMLRAPDGGPIYNVRAQGFGTGTFAMFANDSDRRDLVLSRDRGVTWVRPTSLPPTCTTASGFAANGSTLLFVNDGTACRSTDQGATWTAATLSGTPQAGPLWTGTEFIAWGQLPGPSYAAVAFHSADGAAWTTTNLVGRRPLADGGTQSSRPDIGAVARSPSTGTFVSVRGGWMNWYARQEFYRSQDGVTWDLLATDRFTGSHPINAIAYGEGERSSACP